MISPEGGYTNIIQCENYQEKKECGQSDFPYITYPCSIPLDFSGVPLHWHDEMEVVYIRKGRGIVLVDFMVYHMAVGGILVIVPGQLYTIEQEEQFTMEYENIIFQPGMFSSRQGDVGMEEFLVPLLERQLFMPSCLRPGECGWYEEMAACLDHTDALCDKRPRAYQLGVKGHLFQLFYLLFSHASGGGNHSARHNESLEETRLILKYIETHYMEKIMIEEMAEACGFSQSHFIRFFKSAVEEPLTGYLSGYRLTVAPRLLLSPSSSILDISQETGFENLSYFNRSFEKAFGMTPREFRGRQWELSWRPIKPPGHHPQARRPVLFCLIHPSNHQSLVV